MAAKHKVLSALIDADAELRGDPNGYHHVIVDVIDEIARPHASESELSEAIYELVAQSFVGSGDEEPENPQS